MTQASDNLANINALKGKCDYLQSELSALRKELEEVDKTKLYTHPNCNCHNITPSYPLYRTNKHVEGCRFYRDEKINSIASYPSVDSFMQCSDEVKRKYFAMMVMESSENKKLKESIEEGLECVNSWAAKCNELTAERDRLAAQIKEAGESVDLPIRLVERNTHSLIGWINELGLLSSHPKGMDAWLRSAIKTIWIELGNYYAHPPIREGWVMDTVSDTEPAKCKECGETFYTIKSIYEGRRDRIFIVECEKCKSEYLGVTIPVIIPYFVSQDQISKECLIAWNKAMIATVKKD